MRYIAFLLYAILMCVFALTGCGTDNPICTDSFCIVSRDSVSEDVIEIDESKALAFLETLAVDTPQTTPVETPETSEVSLMDIITDAAAGNQTYLNQTVTVNAVVAWRHDEGKAILLYTSADFKAAVEEGAGFFIFSLDNPARLNPYIVGNTYEFTVTIFQIEPPDDTLAIYKVQSELVE